MFRYDAIFQLYGLLYDVDPKLLKAIAKVESNFDQLAVGPTGDLGLMQINPKAGFNNLEGWPSPDYMFFNPAWSVKIAAQVLAWNQKNYGYRRGIAIYNSWSARRDPENGPFSNQEYVDAVEAAYNGRA